MTTLSMTYVLHFVFRLFRCFIQRYPALICDVTL